MNPGAAGGWEAETLRAAFGSWLRRHPPPGADPPDAEALEREGATAGEGRRPPVESGPLEPEVLWAGEPTVLGVSATMGGRPAHAIIGIRAPDTAGRRLRRRDDPVLGRPDPRRPVAVDALSEAELASLTLRAVTGASMPDGQMVAGRLARDAITVSVADRWSFTAFPWPYEDEHPGVALLTGLDEAGFNHLPAPVARWRRGGQDLGMVQELLPGSADGWAVALTSLRDLYAAGVAPAEAGGDFAFEAEALGTMTARMHLALAEAFGRERGEATLRGPPSEGAAVVSLPVIRTHGDLHLGRTSRCDQGWVLEDCMPGGCEPGTSRPRPRSPLADVGDLLRSLERAAVETATERDPTGQGGARALGRAWFERNSTALLRAYLEAPGIDALLPDDAALRERLVQGFRRPTTDAGR